mmetsp:Transcript_6571/g.19839  ORF Transcript_6571/g.19839 Transcript_6571/m.19839 type:complete len:249 (-) Transcript_6571:174-920(-)
MTLAHRLFWGDRYSALSIGSCRPSALASSSSAGSAGTSPSSSSSRAMELKSVRTRSRARILRFSLYSSAWLRVGSAASEEASLSSSSSSVWSVLHRPTSESYFRRSASSRSNLSSAEELGSMSPTRKGHTVTLMSELTPPLDTSSRRDRKFRTWPSPSTSSHHRSDVSGFRFQKALIPSFSIILGPCCCICLEAIVATAATETPTPRPTVAPRTRAVPSPTASMPGEFSRSTWSSVASSSVVLGHSSS